MTQSLAKNTLFMTVASIGQKVIAFVYFALIARSLGPESAGKYITALTFTTLFVVFVDLGMTNVLVREAAKVKDNIQKYFSTLLSIKFFLGIFSYVAVVLVSSVLYKDDPELVQMIFLSGITMLFDSFHLSMYGVLRALGDLRFESMSVTASQLLSLILGSIFLFFHLPLIYLILAFTVPSALNVIFSASILYKKYHIQILPQFDKKVFLYLGKITIPFAIAAICARVYSYIDSILLSKLISTEAVGWYSTPYKITYAFQFIPLAIIAAAYPRFSEYFISNKQKLATIFENCIKYLLLISVPLAFGVALMAKEIILFVFGSAYIPSIVPLQILIMSLIFSFVSFPIGAVLNACNKQVTQTTIVALVMVVNIVLNLLFIPRFEVVGAALAALIGNILLTGLGYLFVLKVAPISHSSIFTLLGKILVSSLGMLCLMYLIKDSVHVLFVIAAGIVTYCICLFFTRTVTLEELKQFKTQFK